MAIRHYKPTTNGRRGMTTLVNEEITRSKSEKSLVKTIGRTGGRNNQGKLTVREIRLVLLEKLLQLNMIQIEMLTLL